MVLMSMARDDLYFEVMPSIGVFNRRSFHRVRPQDEIQKTTVLVSGWEVHGGLHAKEIDVGDAPLSLVAPMLFICGLSFLRHAG